MELLPSRKVNVAVLLDSKFDAFQISRDLKRTDEMHLSLERFERALTASQPRNTIPKALAPTRREEFSRSKY